MGRLFHSSAKRTARGQALRVAVGSAALAATLGASAAGNLQASGFTLVSNWIEVSPSPAPPPLASAAMAYDAATGQVVLFGGDEVGAGGSSNLDGETWTFDAASATWTEQSPATQPSARYGASMAYDAATGQVVLFGGLGQTGELNDTWTWNGTTWTEQSPARSPSTRSSASMAYDAATGQVVLFGGLVGRSIADDTWTWNGSNWSQRTGHSKPIARYGASMAYDAATGQVVLFGGASASSVLGDTWTWTGSGWTAQSPTFSPAARVGASMAYDTATSSAVLVGGYNGSSADDNDTWTWNGTAWGELEPSASPSKRRFAAMAYDGASAAMVLFGGDPGVSTPSALDDTWLWGSEGTFAVSLATPNTVVGGSESETVTVTGASGSAAPTGTVTFYVCGPTALPAACTSLSDPVGTPVTLDATSGANATATSTVFTPSAAGEWCFAAYYSGDTDYAGVTDNTDGCFSADPPIVTTPQSSTVTLGATDTDTATVHGDPSFGVPTGTVSFSVCGPTATPAGCTSGATAVGSPVTLAAGSGDTASATSEPFQPTATGYWCFAASYSGDGHYPASSDTTTDQCFDVTPQPPAFTSAASAVANAKAPFSFLVTTTGSPTVVITGAKLPWWLTLTDNGDGTATLAATSARKGKHRLTLTATNGGGTVIQAFVLTVKRS
ncbi:MAG TPA: kelch repeat-containing protein [Acidimicrobiales bacterium]|nr:kelch repeat-containing protein [Acidimicrobiales bacterium]